MRAIIEILTVTAIVLALLALFRMLWRKYIGKPTENRHALIENIKLHKQDGSLANIEVIYRLPVGGMVEISLKSAGISQAAQLSKQHKAGFYSFTIKNAEIKDDSKVCLKGPGTYLEKQIKAYLNT